MNTCSECQKAFSRLTHLRRHAQKFHPEKVNGVAPKLPATFQCNICDKTFSSQRYFKVHKKKHEVPIVADVTGKKKLSCSMCDYLSINSKEIIEHFKTHDINVSSSNHEFASIDDFNMWKKKMEHDRTETYVKLKGDEATSKGKIIKYYCHRSGNFTSKRKGVRHMKTQGSNKINAFCPASIKVVLSSAGKCDVLFVETHIGHQKDLGHLFLTSEEREAIAAKISMKIPFTEILNEVRDSVTKSELERVHLLNMKDLYNIEQCFNLKSTSVRHQNDALSVEAWVKEMETSGCILFYKPQNTICEDHEELKTEDFVLIIMNSAQEEFLKKNGNDCVCADGTHGLNQYDFELNTLLVLDDLHEGFPCAFLISKQNDEKVMMLFFNYIKDRVGSIHAKTFMSDMAPSSYNAWANVMGPSEYRLYCTWHVDQALRKNLPKINSKEKQVTIYKFLRTMLQETDSEAFTKMLMEFLTLTQADPDTANFAIYFAEHYANVAERWAYCFRLRCGINTNMHLERMHRSIKYMYLRGQKVKRLDKGINAIMQFLRDKLFDRLITMKKGKLCTKLRVLRKRHKTSEQLDLNCVLEYGNDWQVVSDTHNIYTLQENDDMKKCQCRIICDDCSMCIHRYICTCIDSSVKWNMCKHVHLLGRYLKQNGSNSAQLAPDNGDQQLIMAFDANIEAEAIESELKVGRNCNNLSIAEEVEQLKNSLYGYLDKISTQDEVEAIKALMAPIGPTLAALKSKTTSLNISLKKRNDLKRKIEPQRRLFSVKKKRVPKQTVEMPTYRESQKIAISASYSRASCTNN